MDTILSRILTYESKIFQEYSDKRNLLLTHISELDTNTFTKEQMCIFTHDIKSIIDPIKTSISEIDYYFTNTDFKKTESLEHFKQLNNIYLLFFGLYALSETEETESDELSLEPETSLLSELSESVSLSDSKSPISSSLTFSNTFRES